MKYTHLFFFILCFLFTTFISSGTAFAFDLSLYGEKIRVAILKGAENVTISGAGLLATNDAEQAVALEFPANFLNINGRVVYGNSSNRVLRIAAFDLVKVNGKSYRGIIELSAQNGKLLVVNELQLEQYLVGVINSEISSTWPMEAIKTQAVIARTYAVAKKKERSRALYHLESTTMDQAYFGTDQEDARASRGVSETEGEILTNDGKVIQAFYHANSGGRTESSENVWGLDLPYLRGVECQYGLTSSTRSWELNIQLSRIESALRAAGQKISDLLDIKEGSRNNRGRLKTVVLVTSRGNVTMLATKFRMAVGSTVIKSTNFNLRVEGQSAIFNGMGYGHGVGLCQYGAKQRALDGFNYKEILSYYYPGTKLSKLSEL